MNASCCTAHLRQTLRRGVVSWRVITACTTPTFERVCKPEEEGEGFRSGLPAAGSDLSGAAWCCLVQRMGACTLGSLSLEACVLCHAAPWQGGVARKMQCQLDPGKLSRSPPRRLGFAASHRSPLGGGMGERETSRSLWRCLVCAQHIGRNPGQSPCLSSDSVCCSCAFSHLNFQSFHCSAGGPVCPVSGPRDTNCTLCDQFACFI